MAYEVLARKWRPRTFDDVVGQDHVTRTLANAIEQDRIAHAYLFIGPRGIGKTTLSRIFAMALNCEHGPTMKPCGTCSNCQGIASAADMDVIELDAASNNKVDDIHEVLDQVQFAPTHSRFKIFILDEVHMLTPAAFNALLKTLEEPPPYVKFIFATTEGDKVLPTIISRCQRFDLRRIATSDIVHRLRFICNAEQITVSEDALLAIARGSNGGLRDALSALDQLIAFKGTDVTEADVLAVFGLVSREGLEALAGSVLKGDIAGVLKAVAAFESAGKDMRRLTAELLTHFRNLLVYQQAGEEMAKREVTAEQLAVLKEQAALAQPQRLADIAGLLSELEGSLRASLSVRTLMEMTLIRCARIAQTVPMDEILRRLTALKDHVIRRLAAAAPQGPAAAHAAPSKGAAPGPAQPESPPAPQPPQSAPATAAPRPKAPAPTPEAAPDAMEDPYADAEDVGEVYLDEAAPPPDAGELPPPAPSQPLKTSDGRYADEILNFTLRLFGGTVTI